MGWAGKWQRLAGRKDLRNCSYLRRLVTSVGLVELEVSRARSSGSAGEVLGRHKRRASEVDDAITAAHVHGVSRRKMGKVTEALMGERVGRSTVSRMTRSLEERVEGLRRERIEEHPHSLPGRDFLRRASGPLRRDRLGAGGLRGLRKAGHRKLLAITIGAQGRIRAVGAFPDRASALRLTTVVALHLTGLWSDRKYLDIDQENRKAA